MRQRGKYYHLDCPLPNGDRIRFSMHESDQDTAARALRTFAESDEFKAEALQAIKDSGMGARDTGANLSIEDMIDFYVDTFMVNKGSSDRTRSQFRMQLARFQEFAQRDSQVIHVSQITRSLLERFTAYLLQERKLAPKTAKNYIVSIRSALNAAIDSDMLAASPVRSWPSPKVNQEEIRPLEIAEVGKILSAIRAQVPEYYNIVLWLALTGCRPSDAVRLTFAQVDLDRRVVSRIQKKTRRYHSYEISPAAAKLVIEEKLRRRAKRNDRVFTDQKGEPFTENRLYHQFTRGLARAGFAEPVNPYRLRHTFGFHMANVEKCPLPVLQRMMGHADIKATMKYVLPADGREYTESYSGRILTA